MKRVAPFRWLILGIVSALSALPVTASACSVCMGDPASKTAEAMNSAVFLMLGFVGVMLGFIAAFAFYLARRANAPIPPHAELASMMAAQEDTK